MANASVQSSQNSVDRIKMGNITYDITDSKTKSAVENIQISLNNDYVIPQYVQNQNTNPQSGDSFQTAIQKLNNAIITVESTIADTLTQFNDDVQEQLELPSSYSEYSTSNVEPESGDTLITALSKLHKTLLDFEYIYADALTQLESRISALENNI